MQIEYMHAMLTGVWMLFIGALAYSAGITSLVGSTALLAVALTPTVFMTRFRGCTRSDDVGDHPGRASLV